MKERGYTASDIDETIDQAIHAGMLDDRLFAKLWVDDRVLHLAPLETVRHLGRRMIGRP